jgi:hypothetical protein
MIDAKKSKRYANMIQEFDAQELAEFYQVLANDGNLEAFFESVAKHQTHDQSSHGNWAGTGQSVATTTSQSFSKEEILTAADYIQDGYYLTNKWLRQQDSLPPGDRKTLERTEPKKIELLDSVFQKTEPSQNEQTVYRGVSGELVTKLLDAPIGSTFVDKGYVSTSGMREIAEDFTTVGNTQAPKAVLQINIPAGNKVLQVPKFFRKQEVMLTVTEANLGNARAQLELERILPRGTTFEVTKKTRAGAVVYDRPTSPFIYIELTVVPNE